MIELAPEFAPNHVKNIKALVAEKYFDGLQILRAQDNYVVQWGDPHADARAEDKDKPRPIKTRAAHVESGVHNSTIASTSLSRRCPTATATRRKPDSPAIFPPRAIRRRIRRG